MPTQKRNAIVTGAASGLGRAIALRLARDGWNLALVDLNEAGLAETLRLVEQAGGTGQTERVDVANADAWRALYEKLHGAWEQLDLLVNNAGVAGSGEVGSYSLEDWRWIVDINLMAGVYGCHFCVPWMKRNPRGGHIVNTASLAAIASRPGMAGYNVTKAAMVSLSETLYGELAPYNIGVTVVCPSFFQTNLLTAGRTTEADRKTAAAMMRKASFTAEDVAEDIVRAIRDKRLYVIVPREGRILWRLKRLFPGYALRAVARDHHKQVAQAASK